MPKKVPKYLRNSRDQAICKAICLSLISFCIISCLSSWGWNREQSLVTHILIWSTELIICSSRRFSFFICFCLFVCLISVDFWLIFLWTAIPSCNLDSEISLEYRMDMIFFFCVLKSWMHVIWNFYSTLKYMLSLFYHLWGKIYVPLKTSTSYWPLLKIALKSLCFPNLSSCNLTLTWRSRSISLYDMMVEGYYSETSIEIFLCHNFFASSALSL